MLPSANPYASPTSERADRSREVRPDAGNAKRLCLGWFAVFSFNLMVPLFIGWRMTGIEGRIGMILATFLLLTLGLAICLIARQIGLALVVGGVAIGLSQVIPILQLTAGIMAFKFANGLGIESRADIGPYADTMEAGFVVTVATGVLLAAASVVAGLAIRAVLSLRR